MVNTRRYGLYNRRMKRVLDVILSLIALVLLSPVLIIVGLLIKVKLGSPIIFSQERIGKDGRPFIMYKFRSMSHEEDGHGNLLPDANRIGRFGKLLRASSIDELPALVNIIKGEMSIVGPRPLPTIYGPFFYENENKRHLVRGGLTGLAQVNGRNSLTWEEKFSFDLRYIESVSFLLDLKIVLLTVVKVFRQSDIGVRGVKGLEDFHTYRMHQSNHGKWD